VLNKVDLPAAEPDKVKQQIEDVIGLDASNAILISAKTGDGLDVLQQEIIQRLPSGPAQYPDDYLTDQPQRFLAAEVVREKVLHHTQQEVPHAVAVMIENWEDTPGLVRIAATIYIERPGQKAILIGAGGALLKKIGTLARREIETLVGKKVFLQTFVKVTLPNIRWALLYGVALSAARPTSTVDARLVAEAPEVLAGTTTGSLVVESRPSGARVFVDNQEVGTSPLSMAEVSPGHHRVRLELNGFNPWVTMAEVKLGARTRVSASLEQGQQR